MEFFKQLKKVREKAQAALDEATEGYGAQTDYANADSEYDYKTGKKKKKKPVLNEAQSAAQKAGYVPGKGKTY